MRILNLHGFMGKADNRNYSALCKLMPKEDIVSPKLDFMNEHPAELIEKLSKIIKNEDIDIVIGQSFGGFYALHLAYRCGIPCILTNPCLFPADTGVIVDSDISRDILEEYGHILRSAYFAKAYILLSDNDTIIPDNKERCKGMTPHIKVVEGTHSNIRDLKKELADILDILSDPKEREVYLDDLLYGSSGIVLVNDEKTIVIRQLGNIEDE